MLMKRFLLPANATTRSYVTKQSSQIKELIGLVGICDDSNSSFLAGAKKAPEKIRQCFKCDSSNGYSEDKLDISRYLHDYGNFTEEKNFSGIREKVSRIMKDKRIPLSLGGDHSITAPIFTEIKKWYPHQQVAIVHFDAHPDIYPLFQENPDSHASPFARILENPSNEGTSLISIGVRTINDIQDKQLQKYNVKTIEAKDFPAKGYVYSLLLFDLISFLIFDFQYCTRF
jgi:arginase